MSALSTRIDSHSQVRQGAFVFGLAVGLLLIAQQFLEVPGDSLLARSVHNMLHFPWFFLLTWLLHRWLSSWTWVMVIALPLALGTEILQMFTSREASSGDLVRNLMGLIAAYLTIEAFSERRRRLLYLTMVLGLTMIAASPVAFAIASERFARNQFPVLLDMTDARGHAFARPTAPAEVHEGGIELTINDSSWPGLHISEPVSNWENCETLKAEVTLDAGPPIDLFTGLLLKPGDGITNFTVHPLRVGTQTISVPLDALLPTPHSPVYDVFLYTTGEYKGRRVTFHKVWLE